MWRGSAAPRMSRIFMRGNVTFSPALRRSVVCTGAPVWKVAQFMAASALQVRYHHGALSRNALFTHNVFTMLIFNDFVRTPQRLFAALICSAALVLGSSGCVYRVPIQQGNLLETKDIDQVAVGMTQAQVRYVLGTPMVVDPFSKDRWD